MWTSTCIFKMSIRRLLSLKTSTIVFIFNSTFYWLPSVLLTLLVGRQEGHADCKKLEWWAASVVICLDQDADCLHMAQLMPLPLTVSCFSKIQIGFTSLVLDHPGSPRQRAVKWLRVCVRVPSHDKTHSVHHHQPHLECDRLWPKTA